MPHWRDGKWPPEDSEAPRNEPVRVVDKLPRFRLRTSCSCAPIRTTNQAATIGAGMASDGMVALELTQLAAEYHRKATELEEALAGRAP